MLTRLAKPLRRYAAPCGFLLVLAAAFFFRNAIAERDMAALRRTIGADFVPFSVESAMMYGYLRAFADGRTLAGTDPALPDMPHYRIAEQMSLNLEYVGGLLLRAKRALAGRGERGAYEDCPEESRLVRYWFTLHIALAAALLFLLLRALHLPWFPALGGALIEVFSAAALGRYTGEDLIRGAFALPFLTAFLLFLVKAERSRHWLWRVALFGSVFLSAAAWDASQILIGAVALWEILRRVAGGAPSAKRRNLWLLCHLALVLAALLLPYQRAHGAFFSPVVLWVLPGAWLVNWCGGPKAHFWRTLGVLLLLGIAAWTVMHFAPFRDNYSHFGELLQAKIRFANRLPRDPALLTFDQRYLWTPELHSADWHLTRMVFPWALPLWAVLAVGAMLAGPAKRWRRGRRPDASFRRRFAGDAWRFGGLTAGFFLTFCFFARFRDMTTLLLAVALPLVLALWMNRSARQGALRRRGYWLGAVLILAAAGLEWRNSIHLRRGRPDGMAATAELIRVLRQADLNGAVMLGDMQISPLLKCYAGASILIQPKYELPEVRAITREYLETFFRGSLRDFSDFCARHHVDYVVVHLPAVLTPASVPYSYRYIANAERLRQDSAASLMLRRAGRLREFRPVALGKAHDVDHHYRIFRYISPHDRSEAARLAELAQERYYAGRRRAAARLIRRAWRHDPGGRRLYELYIRFTGELPPEPSLNDAVAKSVKTSGAGSTTTHR